MMKNKWSRYFRETLGATAVVFALIIPVVVGSAGMAIDVANAYMVKQRLSHAIDAAALAAAAMGGTNATAKVTSFFNQNYPEEKIGATYGLTVTVSGQNMTVTAQADYDTTFGRFMGIDTITVTSSATVTREVLGLEVALVLDVTGSMSTNNNIGTLRTAATNFLNKLCPNTTCSSLVKIGIVPFATAVNVGPYGLGKNPNGTTYDTAFVNNPNNRSFNQSQSSQWWGCVLARSTPQDTQNSTSTWKWDMYRYTPGNSPNNGCNKSYILPLTGMKSTIQSRITGLQASGNTLSNLGMVWGYRVLSPEAPFREGAAWGEVKTKKVALLMTDGDNNIGDTYSAYGPWSNLRLTDHDLDVKLAATCENMKADGITIYTITFTSGINAATKNYFRNCASDASKYYDAPSQANLLDAFDRISRELSNIHLTN
ncbi:MAG: hypothetical protein KBC88_00940 [Alphaproteobacteria bacterium]|nr:hypothetical protein [Alphaproteobacteria bacterium]MBP9867480.1 hypothetical protein [Alphaproteobacteria bacterium]